MAMRKRFGKGSKMLPKVITSNSDGLQQLVLEGSVDKTTHRAVFVSNLTLKLHRESSGICDFIHILTITSEGNVSTVVSHGDTVVNDSSGTRESEGTHGKELRNGEQRMESLGRCRSHVDIIGSHSQECQPFLRHPS